MSVATDLENPSVGLDRLTGGIVTGWDHVLQSLGDIFETRFGERVMREHYGSIQAALLGRNMAASDILLFFAAMTAAIDLFEPRVRVARVRFPSVTRQGSLTAEIELLYRPRAALGDFTVEGARRVGTAVDDGRVRVSNRMDAVA